MTRIEELSLNAWPALQTQLYDGWVLRFSEGYTKRANSVQPIYASTNDLNAKISHCERIYTTNGLPTVFKLTDSCFPKHLDAALTDRGYRKLDETSVRLLNMPSYLGMYTDEKPSASGLTITNEPINEKGLGYSSTLVLENTFSKEWLDAVVTCSHITDSRIQSVLKRMLHLIIGQVFCVQVKKDQTTIGCGFGVLEDGYMGIFDIVVDKAYRGLGYGEAIMRGLLKAACSAGVHTAYLQVVVGNTPAEKLYDKLGFQEAYRYWYRAKAL